MNTKPDCGWTVLSHCQTQIVCTGRACSMEVVIALLEQPLNTRSGGLGGFLFRVVAEDCILDLLIKQKRKKPHRACALNPVCVLL